MGQGSGDEIKLNKLCNSQEQLDENQWVSLKRSRELKSTDYKICFVQCLGDCCLILTPQKSFQKSCCPYAYKEHHY